MNNDPQRLREALLADARLLLAEWLPNGEFRGGQFVVGSADGEQGSSLKVDLRTGVWRDFAKPEREHGGKDLISLYAAVHRVSYRDAIKELSKHYLGGKRQPSNKSRRQKERAIWPVPGCAPPAPLEIGSRAPNGKGLLTKSWPYRNACGELLGYAVRFDLVDSGRGKSRKAVLPLFYFERGGWRWAGHGRDRDPVYGQDRLAANPQQPVLLVEGEKTADAAQALFPEHVCVTWAGGVNRLTQADFSPLSGRRVTYLCDADAPGRESIALMVQTLKAAGVAELYIAEPPETLPLGWDVADPAPEGLDVRELVEGAQPIDLAEVEPLQSLTCESLVGRLVYVVGTDQFIDPNSGLRLEPQQLNALFAHQRPRIATSLLMDGNLRKVFSYAYRPGDLNRIVSDTSGHPMFNLWRPSKIQPVPGDATLFQTHLRGLSSTEEEFEWLVWFLAFLVQRPGEKVMWALVIVGNQGTGKSGLLEILRILLGPHNVRLVSTAEIKSNFNEFLDAIQLVGVEEIMAGGRLEIMNNLKPYITQPSLRVNVKYQRPYNIENRANFIFLSNHKDALRLEKGDRRYLVIMSDAEPREPTYYQSFFAWAENNHGVILDWLLTRDLNGFDHHTPPPMTAGKRRMMEASRPELEAVVDDAIRERTAPFEHDLSDMNEMMLGLRELVSAGELSAFKLRQTLLRLGAQPLGQCKAWIEGRDLRRSLWAIRDVPRYELLSSREAIHAYLSMRPDMRPF